jgi:hypothetical protein
VGVYAAGIRLEVWLNRQKSAEGIAGGLGPAEGPNMSFRTGAFVSTAKERQDSMAEMTDSKPEGSGRNPREYGDGASSAAAREGNPGPENGMLMEEEVEGRNLREACRRVVRNRGAAGVDEMTVGELKPFLKTEWPEIKEQPLEERFPGSRLPGNRKSG